MCKKLVCLVSFVLVLELTLTSTANAADPTLVGYWRFDEGSGTIAFDYSGNNYHGTITGAEWVTGYLGGALSFNGADYVTVPPEAWSSIEKQVTVALWQYGDPDIQPHDNIIFSAVQDPAVGQSKVAQGYVPWGNSIVYWDTGGVAPAAGYDRINKIASPEEFEGSWQHWTFTKDADTGQQNIYLNGVLWHSATGMTRTMTGVTAFKIGSRGDGARNYYGMIDDFRLYNRVLTEAEILEAMKGVIMSPALASNEKPADEATDVPRDVVLSWEPGEFAAPTNGHKVYLGDNFDDVNDATGAVAQSAATYTPPQRLDFGTTYYWRVDEANSTTGWDQGRVWQFTVEPFVYPIDSNNITATASSSFSAAEGPENTVNGSGLDADDLHSTESTHMWLSGSEPLGAWIQYEFDKAYKLHEMWVWNSNKPVETIVGFGLKDVPIEYSVDGIHWTELAGVSEFARAPGTPGYAHNTTVDLGGAAAKYVKITANSNWGGLVPQYGLSEVIFFYIPVFASQPNPDTGTTDVGLDATLGFRAGREAATHDVYLSTDEQAVIDGTAPVTTVSEASYGPLSLDLGKTYYWRVDEVNEAETPTDWQGDIWNFATQEYFVLEDFEAYDDYEPNRIFDTWVDGWGVATNGSTAGYPDPVFVLDEHFVETTIVHSGRQSGPLFYDNTAGVTYSEATRTIATPKDWTQAGVKTLTLWFYGDPNNAPAQIYVKIDGVKVTYDGDMSHIQEPSWHQWDIELSSVAGVNLRNVNQIAIGVDGTGSGVVFLDDIRLYPLREPEADLTGN